MMNNTFTMLHDMEYLTLAGDKGKKEATLQFNMKLYSYEAVRRETRLDKTRQAQTRAEA